MKLLDRLGKKKSQPLYAYTKKELERYSNFVEAHFGAFQNVFHELVSPDIHLDVIIVPPTAAQNYYTLVTMGMGAYKMNVPRNLKRYELERAELVLRLPPDWNLHSGEEADYWPIRNLKDLARLPVQSDSWLGFGHTVSANADNTPFSKNTELCSTLLVCALDRNEGPLALRLGRKGKINFYQLFPIYREELEYKQKNDVGSLLDRFPDADLKGVLDLHRKNYGV